MNASKNFSSIKGSIRILLMAFPDTSDQNQYARISAMLRVLPEDAGLLIWCNYAADRDSTHSRLQSEHRAINIMKCDIGLPFPSSFRCLVLSPVNEIEHFTHWVRDPFLFHWGEGRSVRVLKSLSAKLEDESWPSRYWCKCKAGNTSFTVNEADFLPVALGNLLLDEEYVLVGHNEFKHYCKHVGWAVALKQLKTVLNVDNRLTRVIEIGKNAMHEPICLPHIDLYLTLTGIRRGFHRKYVVLLGECYPIYSDNQPNSDVEALVKGINHYLASVRDQLITEGFEPVRIPMPMIVGDTPRNSIVCYYNNCLLQQTDTGNTVWLPRYTYNRGSEAWWGALKKSEEEVASVWMSLGYTVSYVDADFHSIIDEYGSLHCITQEVLRV